MTLKFECCFTCALKEDKGCYVDSNKEIRSTCDSCNNGNMHHEYNWLGKCVDCGFFDIEEKGIFILTQHIYCDGYHFESIIKATNNVKLLYDYITFNESYKRFKVLIGTTDYSTYDKLCDSKEDFLWVRKYNNCVL